jgi:F0F1-type ATP synthase assembly protein I
MNNRLAMRIFSQAFLRFITIQLLLVITVAGIVFVIYGLFSAVSAVYGGLIAITNSSLLYWRKEAMAKETRFNAETSLLLMYRSSLERFLAVALLLYLGMAQFELDALALLSGFIVGQLGLFGIGFKQK